MKVIFCSSYISFPIALSLIDENENDYVLITENPILADFLKMLFPKEKVNFLSPVTLSLRNPIRLIKAIIKNIKYKNEIIKKINFKNADVFFFGVASCDFSFWLLKKLSANNKVYYKPAVLIGHLAKAYGFKALLGRLVRFFVYFINFVPIRGLEAVWFKVDDQFMSEIGAENFDIAVNDEKVKKVLSSKFPDVELGGVLLLCGDIANAYVDEQDYIRIMDELILKLCDRYGHQTIKIKPHPLFINYYSKENDLIKIPSFLPANLVSMCFDVVVGYSSATLIEAAQQGKLVISTIKMMRPTNEKTFASCLSYLEANAKDKICFPESPAKLLDILSNNSLLG